MGAGNVVEGKRPWGLLAQRDFRLLWLGETTSSLGNTVTTVVMPLTAVTLLGANPLAVGVLNAAAWLPWLVIGLPAGAWVDRLCRRPIMLAADFVSLALFAGIPVAAWLGVLSLPLLMVVALLGGTASVFFSTAYRALLPSLVAREDLLEGNSKLQGSEQGARIAGRGLGGLLAQLLGPATALFVDAARLSTVSGLFWEIRFSGP
ncbi:MAG: major facilitator superfamily 1 [Amycolatopsis sp.]|uniref:MFS transporter n=1 Tax=Amycolatopsis sp. TaxID=37632 RepID=UPI002630D287|nr:MFS transporter [Amycolatopsis sp.]MCU1686064.1 major facilitator superfamily 1 [Amycolatopsis sp.]